MKLRATVYLPLVFSSVLVGCVTVPQVAGVDVAVISSIYPIHTVAAPMELLKKCVKKEGDGYMTVPCGRHTSRFYESDIREAGTDGGPRKKKWVEVNGRIGYGNVSLGANTVYYQDLIPYKSHHLTEKEFKGTESLDFSFLTQVCTGNKPLYKITAVYTGCGYEISEVNLKQLDIDVVSDFIKIGANSGYVVSYGDPIGFNDDSKNTCGAPGVTGVDIESLSSICSGFFQTREALENQARIKEIKKLKKINEEFDDKYEALLNAKKVVQLSKESYVKNYESLTIDFGLLEEAYVRKNNDTNDQLVKLVAQLRDARKNSSDLMKEKERIELDLSRARQSLQTALFSYNYKEGLFDKEVEDLNVIRSELMARIDKLEGDVTSQNSQLHEANITKLAFKDLLNKYEFSESEIENAIDEKKKSSMQEEDDKLALN